MIGKPFQSSRSFWEQLADMICTAYANVRLRATERPAKDDDDPFGFIEGRPA